MNISDTGTDGCIAVKTVVKDFGTEICWNIGVTCENEERYFENKEYTQKCCIAKGSTITCKDSFGNQKLTIKETSSDCFAIIRKRSRRDQNHRNHTSKVSC